jgi:predicted ATPase/DNA-binding CsgD family transcriptional regulator
MMERSLLSALSDRELEVLALVADGLSNDAVAGRLMVSVKTVEATTAAVFRKLGLVESTESNRRVQAAVMYVRHAPGLQGTASLPARSTTFVGRRAELVELQRLISQHRCLTIGGPGGGGKTSLALAAARDWIASGGTARFVDLVRVQRPELVADEVIAAFGVVAKNHEIGLRRVRARVGGDPFLVVLDNADDVTAATSTVVGELLRCPDLRVVVTSRSPIWATDEHLWIAPPMTLVDSDELLRSRCTTPLSMAASRSICMSLDGLPLAIELVAARLATLGADHVIDSIEQNLPDLLAVAGGGRHAGLRRALEPSFVALDTPTANALRYLVHLPGGFDLATADALLIAPVGPEPRARIAAVEALVRTSFVAFDGRRHRMLEPIRQYVRATPGGTDTRDIAAAYARHWDDWSHSVSAGVHAAEPALWYARLHAETANVEAALELLLLNGQVETALRIVARLGYPWSVSGGSRPLGIALRTLDASAACNQRWRARATASIASLGSLLASPARDWDAMLTEAIDLLRAEGDEANLAAAYYSLSRHRLSLDGIDDAIDLAHRSGSRWLHGWSLINKASLLTERRAPAGSIELKPSGTAPGCRWCAPAP